VLGGKRDGKTSKPLSLEGGGMRGTGVLGPSTPFQASLSSPSKNDDRSGNLDLRHYDDCAFGRFAE
jgi:hypothetical protein